MWNVDNLRYGKYLIAHISVAVYIVAWHVLKYRKVHCWRLLPGLKTNLTQADSFAT